MGDRTARLTAWVDGHVQGVGFRYWVQARATEQGLGGSATNLPDGRVEVVAEGNEEACRRLLATLRGSRAPGHVTGVREEWSSPRGNMAHFTTR